MKQKLIKDQARPRKTGSVLVPVLIACAAIIMLGGVAIVARLLSKDEELPGDLPAPGSASSSVSARGFRCVNRNYPLQYGTCHPDVMVVQKLLLQQGADLGKTGASRDGVDGQFGSRTLAASQKYLNKEIFTLQDIQAIRKQTQST